MTKGATVAEMTRERFDELVEWVRREDLPHQDLYESESGDGYAEAYWLTLEEHPEQAEAEIEVLIECSQGAWKSGEGKVPPGMLIPPAARVHDPGPRPRDAQPEGGLMLKPSTCPENRDRYISVLYPATLTPPFPSAEGGDLDGDGSSRPSRCSSRNRVWGLARPSRRNCVVVRLEVGEP